MNPHNHSELIKLMADILRDSKELQNNYNYIFNEDIENPPSISRMLRWIKGSIGYTRNAADYWEQALNKYLEGKEYVE
jgi:hypothetical protein